MSCLNETSILLCRNANGVWGRDLIGTSVSCLSFLAACLKSLGTSSLPKKRWVQLRWLPAQALVVFVSPERSAWWWLLRSLARPCGNLAGHNILPQALDQAKIIQRWRNHRNYRWREMEYGWKVETDHDAVQNQVRVDLTFCSAVGNDLKNCAHTIIYHVQDTFSQRDGHDSTSRRALSAFCVL